MDLSRIKPDGNGFFALADLIAFVDMQTESSVSLSVGRFTRQPQDAPPNCEDWFSSSGDESAFEQLGWIDFHYPCKGRIKSLIRLNLPVEFHAGDRIKSIIDALFEALSVSLHDRYIADCFTIHTQLQIAQPLDRYGAPDKFYM